MSFAKFLEAKFTTGPQYSSDLKRIEVDQLVEVLFNFLQSKGSVKNQTKDILAARM
jgi:hypothetical protein